jgi:hypothetical protein
VGAEKGVFAAAETFHRAGPVDSIEIADSPAPIDEV